MFDFVRKHNKLFQILLFVLIVPSFVLFGIQGYQRFSGANLAAKVAGVQITTDELDRAQREQVARLQQMLGANADIKQIDTPEMRMRTLDGLIRQALLQVAIGKQHLVATDQQVQQAILQIPQVAALRKPDGQFDLAAYRALLQAQGLTSEQFEAQVRAQILQQEALGSLTDGIIPSRAIDAAYTGWQTQIRHVRVAMFGAAEQAAQVQPTDADVEAFYKSHPGDFRVPAQADVEYVVLDLDAVRRAIEISSSQAQDYYNAHASEFGGADQRRASHNLITVASDATPAQQQAAKAKAEAIAAQVRKDPSKFAALARADSQDPGSASAGGDLGYFDRNAMVKPFADAVFGLAKVGEIVGPVRTPFGYHVIELTGIKPAQGQSFAQAQPAIVAKLQDQEARKRFADLSDKFGNKVYEDSRSFAAVAAADHLTIQRAQGVTPTPRAGDPTKDPLANPQFLASLFGPNSLRDKRNIPAVELGPDVLASGRILQATPAGQLTFAQAKQRAHDLLVQQRAADLAAKAGAAAFAQLQQGKAQPAWGAPVDVKLDAPPAGLPQAVVAAAFRANLEKTPAYLGVPIPGQGYAIVAVDGATSAPADPAQEQAQSAGMSRITERAVADAYFDELRRRYGVQVLYKPGSTPAQ